MSVKLEDRPIEQVREETVDKLIFNYSRGVISSDAFERRLDEAMASSSHQEIVDLAADLEMDVDPRYESTKEFQFTPNYGPAPEEEVSRINCILGSSERSGQWHVPKKLKVLNVLGSVELDFTDAIFHHQTITIEVMSVLSSDEIYVPEGVNVVCKTFDFLGSVENKCPSIAHRQAPTIVIEGTSILGSIEIKIKRTIKEKFMAFAEQLKSAFNSPKQ